MLRWTERRRAVVVDALRELAGLVAAALVLGQLVGETPASGWFVVAGLSTWGVLICTAVVLAEGNGNA